MPALFFWAASDATRPDRMCLTLSSPQPPKLKSIRKWGHEEQTKRSELAEVKICITPKCLGEGGRVVVDRDTLKSCRHCRHHFLRFPVCVVCYLATCTKVEMILVSSQKRKKTRFKEVLYVTSCCCALII